MFTLSTGSKQTNRFLPAARNEHGQNKALRCDPILIEVDGKTPTGFSSLGSAPDWDCYWKSSWARWVSRNLWNESWKPLGVFLLLLWAWAHPAAAWKGYSVGCGVCESGTHRAAGGKAAPLPPLWAAGKGWNVQRSFWLPYAPVSCTKKFKNSLMPIPYNLPKSQTDSRWMGRMGE